MSIDQIFKKYPKIEIELLLAHVLKKPKEFVFLHPEYTLPAYQLKRLQALINRRLKGEPLAYLLGYKDFFGLRFRVNKHVLIPRPETEWMVEKTLDLRLNLPVRQAGINDLSKQINILDVGTGSGCIAISVAKNINSKNLNIIASDISKKALAVARRNATTLLPKKFFHTSKYGRKIQFLQSDLFENIEPESKFDVIVANLPYVPMKHMQRFVLKQKPAGPNDPYAGMRFEPPFALTDGTSLGLIYQRFLSQAPNFLKPNGIVLLEIDPSLRKNIKAWTNRYLPGKKISFHRDFNRRCRFAEIF
jgi:release factor glutamine methyltransferase